MDKFWLDYYPSVVQHNIDPNDFSNLGSLLNHCADNYPDSPAFTCFGVSITYKQLDDLSAKFSAYLTQDLGLNKGDRFAIMLPNILQFPV